MCVCVCVCVCARILHSMLSSCLSGMSEATGPIISNLFIPGKWKLGSVGKIDPVLGVELKLHNKDQDGQGEVCVCVCVQGRSTWSSQSGHGWTVFFFEEFLIFISTECTPWVWSVLFTLTCAHLNTINSMPHP